jgi:hypothetical protein
MITNISKVSDNGETAFYSVPSSILQI